MNMPSVIIGLFNYEKQHSHQPAKPFNEKLCICETYRKDLYKNEISCQAVCNKMAIVPITYKLIDFKKIRKCPKFQDNFV